jgi:hypothetical protein
MDAKTAVVTAIKAQCEVDVSEGSVLKDFLDSLTLVELAIKIADLTQSNTLFERHDFFVAQTVQDLIDVTDKDLRGEE